MDVTFYRCNHCGNIAVKPFDAGVLLVCCGEQMTALVANSTDAAKEKHVPAVTVDGKRVRVQVGEVEHPMTSEHFIAMICLVTEKGYQIVPLSPEGEPVAEFAIAADDSPVKVYEYCNLHGLWSVDL